MTLQEQLKEHYSFIKTELEEGKSIKSVADKLGYNPGTVWIFVRDNNLPMNNKRPANYGLVNEQKDKIIEMFNNDMSAYAIGKELNIAKCTVLRLLKKYGIDTSGKKTNNHDIPLKNYTEQIIKMFNNGMTQNEIGDEFGFAGSNIHHLLVKNGIDTSVHKYTHSLDESYFEKIDTEAKAYILGLFYADGNVMLGNTGVRISLQIRDKDTVEFIANELKYSGQTRFVKRKNEKCQDQIELALCRKKLADDLCKLGCPPSKTHILKLPTNEQVPEHLFHHFVRGYFDGDGSAMKNCINFTGAYRFIYGLADRLPCNRDAVKIYQRHKDKDKYITSHMIFVNQSEARNKVVEWLYKDATCFMERKYRKCVDNGFLRA